MFSRKAVASKTDDALGDATGSRSRRRLISAFLPLRIWLVLALCWYGWRTFRQVNQAATLSFTVSAEGTTLPYNARLDGLPFSSGDHSGLGPHHLEISGPDLQTQSFDPMQWKGSIDLGQLEVKRARGDLEMTIRPEPLKIQIRGIGVTREETNSHLVLQQIYSGQYQLETRFDTYTNQIYALIRPSQTTRLVIDAPVGAAVITSDPAGASVILSDRYSGTVVRKGITPMSIPQILTNSYRAELSLGDYHKLADFTVDQLKTNRLSVTFAYGRIKLTSRPAGATVTEGGRELGFTPLTLTNVIPGEHLYHLELADHRSHDTKLAVNTIDEATTSITLENTAVERELKAARETPNIDDALGHVEAALRSEPESPEARSLKSELVIKREEQNERAAKQAADQAARDKEDRRTRAKDLFRSITSRERDDAMFDINSWTFSKGIDEVRQAVTSVANDSGYIWEPAGETAEGNGMDLLVWTGRGRDHKPKRCRILLCQVDNQETFVQVKIWDYMNLSILGSLLPTSVRDADLTPVHPDRMPADMKDMAVKRRKFLAEDLHQRINKALP